MKTILIFIALKIVEIGSFCMVFHLGALGYMHFDDHVPYILAGFLGIAFVVLAVLILFCICFGSWQFIQANIKLAKKIAGGDK